MPEHDILCLINDVFALSDGNIKFFRQRLKADAIDQTALYDLPVSFGVASYDVLINGSAKLCLAIISHAA